MSADRRYAPPNGRPTQRTNGYGNFGPAPNLQQQQQQQPQRDPNPLPNDYDAYGDGYGGSNGNGAPPPRGRPMGERPALRPSPSSNMTSMSNDGGVDMRAGNMGYRNGSVGGGSESSGTAISMRSARERFDSPGRVSLGNRSRSPQPGSQAPASQAAQPPSQPTMRSMPSRNRLNERLNARDASPSQPSLHHQSSRLLQQHQQQQQQQQQYQYQQDSAAVEQRRAPESNAEREIIQVLEHIRKEWPALCTSDCVPVQLALQLLDNSSVGRAHEYRNFQHTYMMLQNSLKGVVHEHHQGFNSSIGTFHQIQNSIQESQMKVAGLKETLLATKTSLCNPDSELKKLSVTSQMYDGLIVVLDELEDLRLVPDQLEARISEKRFLTAVEVLQTALRKLRKPELDDIGALGELRSYLANQETALMDILVEELHEHLYLKSPYCQERWQSIAKNHGTEAFANGGSNPPPFEQLLDNMDFEKAATEDLAKNPEADTFEYVGLLVEALNKLGRLQNAVENLKQRLPVELFQIANETINEVDQRHPSSLRGGSGGSGSGSSGGSGGNDGGSGNGSGIGGGGSSGSNGLGIYGSRETQLRADVIYDLLWTLYGKFEAIAEGHRVFHESIKALIRREGAGNNSALLGSFKELWNLYQNEIRTLLNYYVTSHADVYQFSTSPNPGAGSGKVDGIRDHLFRFSDTDAKGIELATEMEALDLIIQAAVPGLTGREKDEKKSALGLRSAQKSTGLGFGDRHGTGTYKSLVDPSVFNMSLLLPPTLVFLQRLKGIVPPGSDLATSTLTSFLDNFLVNVFQPQLDETLAKLTDTVFNEPDSFQQDQNWSMVAKKPIFKGTSSFFTIVTAFCRMLGTIPHDQALSSLLVSQMMRYYDCVFTWFKGLVTKTAQAQDSSNAPLPDDDIRNLRICARFALSESEINDVMHSRWTGDLNDPVLLEKETYLLVAHVAKQGLELSDIIQDKDTISSLCLIYTSMKWLAIKSQGLRHITHQETDTSQNSLPRATSQRWSLMHDKTPDEGGPVYLPLTQDTVQTFDRIVKSYQELASTALRTLHMEIRCQIMHSLNMVLSPTTTPYILDQDILEPDAQILKLNNNLVSYDEAVSRFLHTREAQYIRSGLGRLISNIIVTNASIASPMNMQGCGRMQLNILVLQQNLKNIEDGVDLKRATSYFGMFSQGGDKILEAAHNMKSLPDEAPDKFTHEELKKLLELCYSEQLSDPERGVAAAARRQMDDKMQNLDEIMRQ